MVSKDRVVIAIFIGFVLLIIAVSTFFPGISERPPEVKFEYENFEAFDPDTYESDTQEVTVYKQGQVWKSKHLPNRTVSIPEEDISEMKRILTNRSQGESVSEYRVSMEKIEEILNNESLSAEQMRKRLQRIDPLENPDERDPSEYIYRGKYITTELSDVYRDCSITFVHNSTRYHVTNFYQKCIHDTWRVEGKGDTYVIVSEDVTEVVSKATRVDENWIE